MQERKSSFLLNFSEEQMFFYYGIEEELKKYENLNFGKEGVIHGDLVFTNILLDNKNNIKFIDMRGALGETLTIRGDIFYDYAKIYQSLIGYDFILLDKIYDEEYSNSLINFFENYIKTKFNEEYLYYIKTITKSLLLTLMPIHNFVKFERYYHLSTSI
jgi:aminoglycoside phosphotransferase